MNNKLIDKTTDRHSKAQPSSMITNITVYPDNPTDASIQTLIEKYPNLISPHRNLSATKPKVCHIIETGSNPPPFSNARQLSAQKYNIGIE